MSEVRDMNGMAKEIEAAHKDRNEPGSWRDAVLAGLPHLLVALFVGLSHMAHALLAAPVFERVSGFLILFGVSFFVLAGGVTIFGWRRGWPHWTASWIGYGLVLVMVVLAALLKWLNIAKRWQVNNAIILGGLALAAIGYCWLAGRGRLKGLLVALFLLPMVRLLMTLEFVLPHVEGLVIIGSGLITALAAGAIVRLGSWRAGIGLALGANLLAGLAISYASVYQINVPVGYRSDPTLLKMAGYFAAYMLMCGALVIGPLWGWALWERGRRLITRSTLFP